MLKGIRIKPISRFTRRERLFLLKLCVRTGKICLKKIQLHKQIFLTHYPNIIRAWHRHLKGQTDYFLALKGSIKIGVFDEKTNELNEIVSSALNLQVVRVPGHYWHGFKALGDEPAMLLYFTTNLYDPAHPDEERRPWNDQTLIPKIINGKKDDARVGKPWDWNYPPHK